MRKALKNRFIIFVISMCFTLLLFISNVVIVEAAKEYMNSGIDYGETTDTLDNPERGYMSNYFIKLSPYDSEVLNTKKNFCHFFFDIGSFSNARNSGKRDMDFTKDMLASLSKTFDNLRENGGTAIIRFSYDNYEGIADAEPSMGQILRHVNQLKPIFYQYEDVISSVEAGFFGKWGEMNSSQIITKQNTNSLINALLNAIPKTRTINVRTPRYYAEWLGIDINKIDKYISTEGSEAYRIGIYNDGYLGSASDLGTFADRDKELIWLSKQSTHTFYGGEVPSVALDDYYLPSRCLPEMQQTNLTYLNGGEYASWKQIYRGSNKAYQGQTIKKYITDHMGYRFVIRKSELYKKVSQGGKFKVNLNIENTGFANVVNQKEVEIILLKDNKYYREYLRKADVREWKSNTVNVLNISTALSHDISPGKWEVYLRVSNPNTDEKDDKKWTIAFANDKTWNADLCANYLGSVTVVKNIFNFSLKKAKLYTLKINMVIDGNITSKSEYDNKDLLYQYISKKVYIKNDDKYLYILVEDKMAQDYQVVEMGLYNENNKKSYRIYSTSSSTTESSGYMWYGIGTDALEKKTGYAHEYKNGSIELRIPLGTMFGTKNNISLGNFYIRFMDINWGDISSISTDKTYTINYNGGIINKVKLTQ